MSASQETCPFCEKEFGSEETVVIGKKGADGINSASDKRGDNIIVAPKTRVHKSCRANYINQNYIDSHKKTNQLECTPSVVSGVTRVLIGGGGVFIYSCSARLIYFEMNLKTK
jgi:hypothetical protein